MEVMGKEDDDDGTDTHSSVFPGLRVVPKDVEVGLGVSLGVEVCRLHSGSRDPRIAEDVQKGVPVGVRR